MFPGPTELRLIGYWIESIWIQKIQIKYIDTKNQLADILTKGNFTRDEWNHLLCSFNITQDESYCKGSLESVIFDVRKLGEEKLWKSKSLECES